MQPNMRRNLPGTFLARRLAPETWCLSRREPARGDVFVRGADPQSVEALAHVEFSDIDIEWREATVLLTAKSAQPSNTVRARSVIVHEPLPRLYDALALPTHDARAQRFWRNIFRLVRIPGGRCALGVLARRKRDSR